MSATRPHERTAACGPLTRTRARYCPPIAATFTPNERGRVAATRAPATAVECRKIHGPRRRRLQPPDRKSDSGRQQCRLLTTPGYAELRAPSSQACAGDVPWASRASGSARGARRKVPRKLRARARAIFWTTSPRAAPRAPSRSIPVNHPSAELKTQPNQFRPILCLTKKNVLR
jgi:hypothetical protein